MENKKKISALLIKKSQERLVKAFDQLESVIENKISLCKSSQTVEFEKFNNEISQLKMRNRELTFALDKLTGANEYNHNIIDGAVVELDETIENIEKILKVHNAGN